MKTVLITGGAGFLGKNLISYLITSNNASKVIVIDNFITSKKEEFLKFINKNKYSNLVHIFEGDICDWKILSTFMQLYSNVDEIYHFASLASPKYYKKYPLETLDVGFTGTKNVLELCKHYSCKMLFSSTSEVYGDPFPQFHPQQETYNGNVNTMGERSCYDESKRVAESLVYSYQKLHCLDVKVARIFNTYGPHMDIDDGRIVTEIVKYLLQSKNLYVYGDGNQTRSLCYVDDTIKMLVKLMNSDEQTPVNIGSQYEISINDLIKLGKNIMNGEDYGCYVKYIDIDKDDPKIRKPCLLKNKTVLGAAPFTPIFKGLQTTIDHFKESL
jgi:UDP-glucuronate decarboxylase